MNTDNHIINQMFRTTADGTRIFFPYGAFGKGRIVDSDATYNKIITHQYFWFFVPLAVVSITIRLSWFLFIISTLVMCLINYITTQRLVKNLATSEVRITWKDTKSNMSKLITFSKFTNWLLIFSGSIISYVGAMMALHYRFINDLYLGITVISIGMGIIVLAICSIINRRSQPDGCIRETG